MQNSIIKATQVEQKRERKHLNGATEQAPEQRQKHEAGVPVEIRRGRNRGARRDAEKGKDECLAQRIGSERGVTVAIHECIL